MKSTVSRIYKNIFKKDMVFMDYYFDPKPRQPHRTLLPVIKANEPSYKTLIEDFVRHKEVFLRIKDSKCDKGISDLEPFYNNGFLPGLDIIAIYGMLAYYKPKTYFEIGSGNSTKVARLAVQQEGLPTRIVSLDPQPRAQIDHLADEIIRKGINEFDDLSFIADQLEAGDILFYDGTHIAAPNSDVTVFFMELLPLVKKGVIVQVHDIYLPYDYPQFMCDRYYSEQYVLAAFLMANPEKYEPVFPSYYLYEQQALLSPLNEVLETEKFNRIEKHGGSFWFRINQ